jgi:hypothetical protein
LSYRAWYSALVDTVKQFSKVDVPIYVPQMGRVLTASNLFQYLISLLFLLPAILDSILCLELERV